MFTDVNCPFCRRAHDWLKSKTNYTLYVFLYPLNIHHHSHEKSVQVLCSEHRETALENALSGKEIGSQTCETGEKMLARHIAVARKAGVHSTPVFVTAAGVIISGWGKHTRESILKN